MTLRRPAGMRDYFKDVQTRADGGPRFDADFDQFFLCLMVGLEEGRMGPESDLEPAEFNKDYTAPYEPYSALIAGLLVDAEIRRAGVDVEDKDAVQAEMIKLLELGNSTQLTDSATTLLSRYAARGFEKIRQAISRPHTLEEFLVAYHQRWGGTSSTESASTTTTADDEGLRPAPTGEQI